MPDRFAMQVSSEVDEVSGLPQIAIDYPNIRTENISGNIAAYSPTMPDEFKVWGSDVTDAIAIDANPDYDVAYWYEVDNETADV